VVVPVAVVVESVLVVLVAVLVVAVMVVFVAVVVESVLVVLVAVLVVAVMVVFVAVVVERVLVVLVPVIVVLVAVDVVQPSALKYAINPGPGTVSSRMFSLPDMYIRHTALFALNANMLQVGLATHSEPHSSAVPRISAFARNAAFLPRVSTKGP